MKYLFLKSILLIFLLITTQSGLAVLPTQSGLALLPTALRVIKLPDPKAIKDDPALDRKQEYIDPKFREAVQELSTKLNHFYSKQTDKGNTATKEYSNNSDEDSIPKASVDRYHIKFNGQMDTTLEERPEKNEDSVNTEITLEATPASPKTNRFGDNFKLVALGKEHYEQLKTVGIDQAKLEQQFLYNKDDYMDNTPLLGICICPKKCTPPSETYIEDLFDKGCKVHIVKDPQNQRHVRLFHGTALNNIASFHNNGIQPVGDGNMGRGFYLSSNIPIANLFAYIKATNYGFDIKKSLGMIIEIWVPFGLKVKQHPTSSRSDPTPIEQRNDICFKFVVRDEALPKLKPVRGYITRY